MRIGNREFDIENQCYIMGILNITPDSFSDGGLHTNLDAALYHTERMIAEGADIIDVGGESTRPGYIQISEAEEVDRIASVLEGIRAHFDVPISLDTYKSGVLQTVLPYVDMVNDIWGLKQDEELAKIVAKEGLACCLMHNRKEVVTENFWEIFLKELEESVAIAKKHGIAKDRIILDGGIGFQKSYEQSLQVINRTDEIRKLGYPIMLGTSRKGTLGKITGKEKEERVSATVATTVVGMMRGAAFVRVHDVDENCDAIKVTKSILEEKLWIR